MFDQKGFAVATTCRDVRHLYDAYLDGELSPSLAAEVQAHLLQCPECQREVEMARACGHLIASDPGAPVLPDDFASRVVAQLDQPQTILPMPPIMTRRQRRRVLLERAAAAFVPAAAAILLLVVLIVPPASREPESPRVVLGDSSYRPIDALGVREWVGPTFSTLQSTGRMADELQGLYHMTVREAESRIPIRPEPYLTAVPVPTLPDGSAFLTELLNPLIQVLSAPPPPPPDDEIVRF